MSVDDLLRFLADRSIRLYLEDDRLRYRAPAGALTAELRCEIAGHRLAIIKRLRMATGDVPGPRRCTSCDRRD